MERRPLSIVAVPSDLLRQGDVELPEPETASTPTPALPPAAAAGGRGRARYCQATGLALAELKGEFGAATVHPVPFQMVDEGTDISVPPPNWLRGLHSQLEHGPMTRYGPAERTPPAPHRNCDSFTHLCHEVDTYALHPGPPPHSARTGARHALFDRQSEQRSGDRSIMRVERGFG